MGNTKIKQYTIMWMSVHPHMRGEYSVVSEVTSAPIGSSPHAWGIQGISFLEALIDRFIPTCVGNTNRCCWCSSAVAVHPHMRGEYDSVVGEQIGVLGSSPHAWGIRIYLRGLYGELRFIPTCVGNTSFQKASERRSSVHPHMRGEYSKGF